MPRRDDLESILIIGAGPIIIGQACEFDYSGVQACRALMQDGYRVILVNSNPATIMSDPDFAHATYIEPITWRCIERVIAIERPSAILPTMGGQTALNCALDLDREGVLKAYGVEMIGACREVIDRAEDRQKFQQTVRSVGLKTIDGHIAHNMEQANQILEQIGLPLVIRPHYTLGGSGSGIAWNQDEFDEICKRGLLESPTSELLIERSIVGWKEFEMEVVRDAQDNCIIVCSIENVDPMGIHTGDSITVAPAMTLTDRELQRMRNASIAILRAVGVETGGSNVQFAINPEDGDMVVIEMNPRVSRSSALASKATGFPIARVACLLAVGYTLDELRNDITGSVIPASFEPSIDYIVTKVPRFDFSKVGIERPVLGTQMQSVGEAMALGRTFAESLQKAICSLELDLWGLNSLIDDSESEQAQCAHVRKRLKIAEPRRLWHVADAFRLGLEQQEIHALSGIDSWFLSVIRSIVDTEQHIRASTSPSAEELRHFKRMGFSDVRIAYLMGQTPESIFKLRRELGVLPVYKRVDSCAAEFPVQNAYMYSCYEEECEAQPNSDKKIMIVGGGPNRIGQGIEFDYCCVHAAMALREDGWQTIMVNCNPETVSTDYDVSDRLYFEPLTFEHVMALVELEKPDGLILQFGGQTPLKLAEELALAGAQIIGTGYASIHRAEDREQFQQLLHKLQLKQAPNATITRASQAKQAAAQIGYPIIVRPSYVLGGSGMQVVNDDEELMNYIHKAVRLSRKSPVLLDKFIYDACEVDVDAVADGKRVFVGGIMEHIEPAGVHSGDSSSCLPPFSLSTEVQQRLRSITCNLATELGILGLMNVQYAIQNDEIFVLEVNPRAARTVPFISKVIGIPMAKIAARCMTDATLDQQGIPASPQPIGGFAVKESVFPFIKFPESHNDLGPQMKSTGEVMGVGRTFGEAFGKSQMATYSEIPRHGTILISLKKSDRTRILDTARYWVNAGFSLLATPGTARALQAGNVAVGIVDKIGFGRPDVLDKIKNGEIQIIVNTVGGKEHHKDAHLIRKMAIKHKITLFTTIQSVLAAADAHAFGGGLEVYRLQSMCQDLKKLECRDN